MFNVNEKLPTTLMKVRCMFHGSFGTLCPGYYIFNPLDKTFRTPRGRNKTHRVKSWDVR